MVKIKKNHTFLTGVFLAINAIKDAFLLMDGPDCVYKRIELIEKNHDFYSNLIRRDGKHRISSSVVDCNTVALDRNQEIEKLLLKIASYEKSKITFISAEPMANLIGIDYNNIANKVSNLVDCPVVHIPYKSLDDDWINGYELVLEKIAQTIKFNPNNKKKKTVAIIGYFFERNEGDHLANVNEMKCLLNKIGIDVSSIWLSGSYYDDLKKADEADLIISLPYAKKTANIISKKTGTDIIESQIPFGIEGTKKWLINIARYYNLEKKANKIIDEELIQIIPLVQWLIPCYFQGKRFSFSLDPFLVDAMLFALDEIDAKAEFVHVYSKKDRIKKMKNTGVAKYIYSEKDELESFDSDFFISNSGTDAVKILNYKANLINMGFPSFEYHCMAYQPFLGFKGFVVFLNRLVNVFKQNNKD